MSFILTKSLLFTNASAFILGPSAEEIPKLPRALGMERTMLMGAWDFDSASMVNARRCRSEFKTLLRQFGDSKSDFDAAEIIFGELLGNVVRHAPGRITIRLEWEGLRPYLIVHDEEETFSIEPRPLKHPLQESGRGLYIIEQFSVSLKVEDIPDDGTRVTAELPVFRNFRRFRS